MVGKIPYLARTTTSAHSRSMYLRRYHDVSISDSGVWRILKRMGVNRLPASQRHRRHDQRWKRYEKPLPGHQVQVDVKFIEPIAGVTERRYYQYTAIDDCTRLRALRIFPKNNQKTAIAFVDYLLARLPFPVEAIQTDNGSEFSRASPGICSIVGSAMPTSRRPPRGSTGRSSAPIAPMPRVLPDARGGADRRLRAVQRPSSPMGGLLQLRPAARGPGRADSLRTTAPEDHRPGVSALRQSHI